ncbi:DMT family transporter [Sporosalibacterium faouarense]|uniref:DMT family transporter n=1 Tax=Sporosalibacterium faouarense TaxID=516123 RepID=UPI00141D6BE2|nr:DMT family transporter [Sporosalibacterium faouarense]MTI48388.1 DMT family transporter [Bacillota bacterium]
MKNQNIIPVVAMIFTVVLWGLSFLSIDLVVHTISPMTLGFLRFFIASILLTVIVKIKEPKSKIDKKDIPLMGLAGFVGVTLYFFFENNGIKLLNASTASLIVASIPIFTLIFDTIIYKEKMTKLKILGVFFSFIGVYFIVGGNIRQLLSSDTGLGYIMMFGAVLSWVAYTLITKPLFGKYSQLFIVYYQSLFGTILFIPFIFFEKTNWSNVTGSMVLNVLYLGIFCSALAYITYVYGMEYLGVSISSIYLNVIPLVTVVASFLILDEKITINKAIGGVLIIVAVTASNWKRPGKKKRKKVVVAETKVV